MLIHLSPKFSGDRLAISVAGEVVTLNGEAFDFAPLEAGGTLPLDALNSPWFVRDVQRDSAGELVLTLNFPHATDASYDARFPQPVSVTTDGPVNLPDPEPEVQP
jgi:hypothetical protein